MAELARVELALGGLDARPLDREAVRVLLHLAEQREILAVSVVVVAGDSGRVTVGNPTRLLFELPPVVVAVITFDLVGGAGGAPEETVGESQEARALGGLETLGGGQYSQATGLSPSRSTWRTPA